MIQIKKYLSKYDYIGHFHNKRSPLNYYLPESKEIMYMMINCQTILFQILLKMMN